MTGISITRSTMIYPDEALSSSVEVVVRPRWLATIVCAWSAALKLDW
jgi:hypothetical protein